MSWEKWVPFSVRRGGPEARAKYEALVEEPPVGLRRAIVDFFGFVLVDRVASQIEGEAVLYRERLLALEQALHVNLHARSGDATLDMIGKMATPLLLDVVDFSIYHFRDNGRATVELAGATERARFAYTIDISSLRVVGVLPVGVQETVERAFGVPAAQHELREAVHWSTGSKQDGLKAFDAMIRALESVVIPVLSAKDKQATLGKVLGGIRAGATKLDVSLPRGSQAPSTSLPTVDVVRGMLELVWSGYERHSTGGIPPSADDARALLGVTAILVDWFGTGRVKKGS